MFLNVTLIGCMGYALILLILCYSLPFSMLFRLFHSYESLFRNVEKATTLRTIAAKEYFDALDPKSSQDIYKSRLETGNTLIAVGIITVKRNRESRQSESLGYLYQSVSLMDRVMKQYSFFSNSVPFICNVDLLPQQHLDAVNLYQFLPFTERYGENSFKLPPLRMPNSKHNFRDVTTHKTKYQKESFDYSYCLLSAARLRPRYILLIEDDTLPHADFPVVLEHILNSRLHSFTKDKHETEFLFLKMYFPAKWQGFAFEFKRIADLLSWSLLGATILNLFYCYFLRRPRDDFFSYKIALLCFILSLTGCLLVGRQNVSELWRLSKHFYRLQSSEGCCTQAMLYPVSVVNNISHQLLSSGSTHTDLVIMDFSYESPLPGLQVEPNLFFHTGLHTTLNLGQKHPEEFIFHL